MHRPTKQHKNLGAKLAKKQARSRKPGAKQKRWKKAIDTYQEKIANDKIAAETINS